MNNNVRMHCLVQCMWECILVFAHGQDGCKFSENVSVSQLTSRCYLPLYLTHCHCHIQTHTPAQGYQRPVRTSPLAGLRWKRTGTTWRSNSSNAGCQKYGFFLSFFDSLLLTSIENQKHKNRGCGDTQLTVNNKILTV